MKRTLLFSLGVLVCAWKGAVFFYKPIDPNGEDVSASGWGLDDPRLDSEWARIGNGEPLSHTLTNIVVEWFEMDKTALRRGVKLFSLSIVLSGAAGYILGAL